MAFRRGAVRGRLRVDRLRGEQLLQVAAAVEEQAQHLGIGRERVRAVGTGVLQRGRADGVVRACGGHAAILDVAVRLVLRILLHIASHT